MNTERYIEAIGDRVQGQPASRLRALAMAGTAGFAVAAVVYRVLREPAD
jgi:hypothetical protein